MGHTETKAKSRENKLKIIMRYISFNSTSLYEFRQTVSNGF